jgi:pimeloyl-ACP methyl ester carboxylesterase
VREPNFSLVEGLAVWDFPGEPGAPTVLFCHATSFHGRSWDGIVARLPGAWRAVALDLRGHGRSTASPKHPVLWKDFGRDVALAAEKLDLRGAIGVGHSMGGHATAYAAILRPVTFAGMLLLDPVIRPSARYGKPWFEDHYARRRRNAWSSWEKMFERFKSRPPFDAWDPRMLEDYCRHALKGGELACSPEYEASIYEQSSQTDCDLGDELSKIRCPVIVMRSHIDPGEGDVPDMNWSPCDPLLAQRLPNAVDRKIPIGHFIPMEAPDRVAEEIRNLAAAAIGSETRFPR